MLAEQKIYTVHVYADFVQTCPHLVLCDLFQMKTGQIVHVLAPEPMNK